MKYCAVNIKEGGCFLGHTKEDIINCVFDWFIDTERKLNVAIPYGKSKQYHSYSLDYSDEEMQRDAINFLFDKLKDYNWITYINYETRI